MNISTFSIQRPVATLLLWMAVVVTGIAAWFNLPISALPRYDSPVISVTGQLPGASPETMATSVARPLEKEFSTIPGLLVMTSSSLTGNLSMTLEFDPSRSIDAASVDVQSALFRASKNLPVDMTTPPAYRKVNPADAPILFVGINSPSMSLSDLDDYAENLLSPAISTINGVAQVNILGQKRYAVRVEADPDRLSAHDMSLAELGTALKNANANSPVGELDGHRQMLLLEANKQLKNAAQFSQIIIATRNGLPVRLGDVATVQDSVENINAGSWINGERSIVLSIQRQPDANTVAVVDAIKSQLPHLRSQMPSSVNVTVLNDRSISIRDAIRDVNYTMLLTIFLVVLVILLFLRRATATLIPSVSLPVSLIATFALMKALDFSLDNISLMGLTIAVGIVVDDAIVVLENIVRHVEEGVAPMQAAIDGAKEVGFTVISISISLIAVFIPIFFMPGTIGLLFHEFAVVVSLAIVASACAALTLIPLLASRFIKHEDAEEAARKAPAWSRGFEALFDRTLKGYDRTLHWVVNGHRWIALLAALATLIITIWLYQISPKGFFPEEDIGQVQVTTEAAQDISYDGLARLQDMAAKRLQADPAVATLLSSLGSSPNNPSANNTGRMFINLKARDQRPPMAQVLQNMRRDVADIPGIALYFSPVQNLRTGGRSSKSRYQYTLQAVHPEELDHWSDQLLAALRAAPSLKDVNTDALKNGLQAHLMVDRDKANQLGVDMQSLRDTLYNAFGTHQVSTLYLPQDSYEVILEIGQENRYDESGLDKLKVRSSTGALVPLLALGHIERTKVNSAVNHQGQLPAVTISFNLTAGASLSDAATAIDNARAKIGMPDYVSGDFQGDAAVYKQSQGSQIWLILIAIAVIYVVLGVLYESWIHPVTILAGIPSASVGALLALRVCNLELTFIAMVGILLLVGIVKKNAIMMIDFALEAQRHQGLSASDAILQACQLRFRPIMMTTFAAMMGALPIALGIGAGAELRQPMGVAIVGGLLISQLITLYVTPVLFLTFDGLASKRRAKHEAKTTAAHA
ncbi:efflux RND transporter permease subunit [Amantichitinum ursilacus]|uniref:Multidrug resistance protein MdtC n=1 Tax=Amantichitinum ursilacus TaxID=857265 RepID=A0A0N0GPY2_9NEIS|nr:efflux RND transporter permease subunit [Amantichitinum ursilacus]KPC53922.1 Multidrug resistance protein MdtC [Amantichitinum ursilacus]